MPRLRDARTGRFRAQRAAPAPDEPAVAAPGMIYRLLGIKESAEVYAVQEQVGPIRNTIVGVYGPLTLSRELASKEYRAQLPRLPYAADEESITYLRELGSQNRLYDLADKPPVSN